MDENRQKWHSTTSDMYMECFIENKILEFILDSYKFDNIIKYFEKYDALNVMMRQNEIEMDILSEILLN